jgi:DNA-binding transcriptional ArsR family regulator
MATSEARETEIFRALADPTRRAMLGLLRSKDANVSELGRSFDMSQSAVSQHLKILRDAKLVRERKSGRERIYSLNPAPLAVAYDWLADYTGFWEVRLLKLGEHLRKKHAKKNPL